MNADPKVVQELFAQAIAITDIAEREKFLADRCAGNSKVYERVVRLIAAYDGRKNFLDNPTNAMAATQMHSGSGQQPGSVIAGRYKLLEAIGEGGMGTVWVAEQTQPVRRKVALKLVKPGMDSKQVLARFDAERQALALMDHPNIAKIFDGGVTEQGRPFFVMEYVKGMPLTEYCDQVRLPVEERLKLFVPICQAVQHAHQKGIIHRDLKPSNVLICLYDEKPVPKIIDFGLAKAMHQPLTEQTVHTGHGLMIGTPLYMSPEQAEQNNLDVDTRTDVYSLGVMLYELLTGSTPLEKAQLKEAAFGEILRLIKEVEPPKPSTRVSTSLQLPNIAAQRNLEPAQLGRSIRGDLDWIVMKAIEKERERRYDTANGLARDIERFLNLEAVEACPPSTSYRLRRLARKHRALISTATALAAILILGAGLSVWQAIRATKAESLASQRLVDVQAEQLKTQSALEASQESERHALDSESAAVAAREAEEQAKTEEAAQRNLAEQQRDEATRLQVEATAKSNELQVLTEEQRRVIYVSEMSQVRIEAQRGNLARMREILLNQLPIDGKEDLRGFEWNYWYRYLNQAKVLNKFDKATVDSRGSALVTVLPGGEQVAWTQGRTTELVDLEDGTSRRLPFQLRHYVDRIRFSDTGRAVVGACLSNVYPLDARYAPPGTDQGSSTSCSVVDPTGQVHTFTYPKDAFKHISALNISSDGTHVVVLGYDVTHAVEKAAARICIWNVDSKQLILNEVYPRELNRVSFSPDGKKIAAYLCHGSKRNSDEIRGVVAIIDVVTGKEMAVAEHDDDVDSLFWLPGSDRVLLSTLGFSGANRKQLLSWQTEQVAARPVLLTRETMPDYGISVVSSDGSTLATTSHTMNNIRLFDTTRGDVIDTLQTDGKGIVSLAYSADGRELTATTVTGEVLRWNLGKDRDLFALRTNPLPRIATNGYSLSQDQSLLTIALADGTVLTRTRGGIESKLRTGNPSAQIGSVLMKVSPDNSLLAFRTNVGPDGKLLSRGKGLLEVYDLVEKRRLWQAYCVYRDYGADEMLGTSMEFSSDGEKLIQVADLSYVFDALSGTGTAFDLRNETSSQAMPITMRRNPVTGALFVVLTEPSSNGEAQATAFDPLTGSKMYGCSIGQAALAIPALDGEHYAVARLTGIEIWNFATGEKILSAPGIFAVFSPVTKLFAAVKPELNEARRTLGITIWDLSTRRQLCELALDGDAPREVRFSPDGKRLLTLHGKTKTSPSDGTIPRGRLWDVETGREILDLPVADVNHYEWDLFFDASGQQLTQLLFTKSTGTIGGGATAFYDARPLEPSVDNGLAADRLVGMLTSKFALKREWIAEIESRSGLKPGIRDAALARVRDAIPNHEQIAKLIGEIVGFSNRSLDDYQRAITWAEELNRVELSSFRSRALLGAAYYRADRLDDALHALMAVESDDTTATTDMEKGYEKVRQSVLALVYFRMGKKRDAQESSEVASKLPNQLRELFAIALAGEAATLIPKRLQPTAPESMPNEDNLKKASNSLLSISGTADFEFDKLPFGAGHRLVAYDTDQDQRLKQEELLEALKDVFRFGGKISGMEDGSTFESQLEFLDETIREAPRYLTARFARAWIRATCPDARFRDAGQALEDAKAICELTKYQDATFLEALAAAFAANGDFPSAIHWQTATIGLYRETGTPSQQWSADAQSRLEAYEKHQLRSSSMPIRGRDLMVRFTPPPLREREASAPYFAPDAVPNFRRIEGAGGAFSPDGTKIVRSIKAGESNSVLAWVDLASGEKQNICEDGLDPVWAASPSERIYFARVPQGVARTPFNQTIWQCDPDGKNLTQLMAGFLPHLLNDESLLVVVPTQKTIPTKYVAKGYRADQQGTWRESGLDFELEGIYSRLSPDGRLMATSMSELVIRDVVSKQTLQSLNLLARVLGTVTGAWSPDGRYYAFGSVMKSTTSGLWILDVTTGENRLLADIDATNPCWSPDGRFIAADERDKNQIVILDVGTLHLDQGPGNH